MLLTTGRLKIHRKCTNIRKSIGSLVWDEKEPRCAGRIKTLVTSMTIGIALTTHY